MSESGRAEPGTGFPPVALAVEALVGAFMLWVAVVSIFTAWAQHHRLATYRPMRATVLSSAVGVRGSPRIKYRYAVGGREYESARVYPVDAGRVYYGDGESVVARFEVGRIHDGYYDPDDPSRAFLVPRSTFEPYFAAMGMVLFLALTTFVHVRFSRLATPPAAWARRARGAALAIAVLWVIVGLATGGHYFVFVRPLGAFGTWTTAIYAALGIVPVMLAGHLSRRERSSASKSRSGEGLSS